MLNRRTCLSVTFLVTAFCLACQAKEYSYRWFWVSPAGGLPDDKSVEQIRRLVKTAAEHGLNGMVLSAGLDRLDTQRADYLERLEQLRQICKENDIEIIPNVFSVGYGGAILAYDKNLAAGIPVEDALYVVQNGIAHLLPDPPLQINNGGFEQSIGNTLSGFRFHDRPGEVSFVDTQVFRSGKASLRFENFGKYEYGHARVMQDVKVHPRRCYRISCWLKTESIEPEGCLQVAVLGPDGRDLAPWQLRIPPTSDWQKVVMGFNSLGYDSVRLYVGAWGGKAGKFWVDDLQIEEVGLMNVLRRPGTPVTVKNDATHLVYEEGRDYARIEDPRLNFRFDHDPPTIKILPAGRITDGQWLRVSYYHGMAINRGQVSVCMSEPKLYEIMRRQAELIHNNLAPNKYLLSMDEIRAGGACETCKKRNMTMAQILGDCITRQVEIIRSVNPKAEVLIWSDMLDPNHNARDKYFLVDGDYTGSWKYVPKDLTIVCWYYQKRAESLKFFSSHGFRTIAGAYYDNPAGGGLENPRGWLKELEETPKAVGIIYTTWENKYEHLAPFADLVSGKNK
jgi:hypothetical protein